MRINITKLFRLISLDFEQQHHLHSRTKCENIIVPPEISDDYPTLKPTESHIEVQKRIT